MTKETSDAVASDAAWILSPNGGGKVYAEMRSLLRDMRTSGVISGTRIEAVRLRLSDYVDRAETVAASALSQKEKAADNIDRQPLSEDGDIDIGL